MGFLSLFNPQTWLALGGAACGIFLAGLTVGGVIEYRLVHAGQLQAQIVEMQEAARLKEAIIGMDADQAAADRLRADTAEAQLKEITDAANSNPAACRFSQSELVSLCALAGGGRQCGRPVPAASKRPAS